MSDQDNTTQPELKPCPFCGCSMSVISILTCYMLDGLHSYSCILFSANLGNIVYPDNTRSSLVKDWNRRA